MFIRCGTYRGETEGLVFEIRIENKTNKGVKTNKANKGVSTL